MKILNKRFKGGAKPIHLCPCGSQIDTQAAPKKPHVGSLLYCSTDCGHFKSTQPKS